MSSQPMLLEPGDTASGGPPGGPPAVLGSAPPAARLKEPNRKQVVINQIDLEKLIPADHLARGIWALVESLPTEGFLKGTKVWRDTRGGPGRAPRCCWEFGCTATAGRKPGGRKPENQGGENQGAKTRAKTRGVRSVSI